MRATFHGVVTGQARDRVLSGCHGLVMPSRRLDGGRTEGAPVALLEALALGLPVVATSVGGIPEVLEGRRGAWLVEPEPGALRQGVLALCEALALGAQIG
jgi:glycosyltransferase involved in cell wall biosynthesis